MPKLAKVGRNYDLARAYFKLLKSIDWEDELLVRGLREGLNKFLSNAHLASLRGRNKYHKTHFVSSSALRVLETSATTGLVFEHLVPKGKYIQEPCESRAKEGSLDVDFIRDRLDRFWYFATITAEEDRLLARRSMPDGWDGEDIFARYKACGIRLTPNPYFVRATDA